MFSEYLNTWQTIALGLNNSYTAKGSHFFWSTLWTALGRGFMMQHRHSCPRITQRHLVFVRLLCRSFLDTKPWSKCVVITSILFIYSRNCDPLGSTKMGHWRMSTNAWKASGTFPFIKSPPPSSHENFHPLVTYPA